MTNEKSNPTLQKLKELQSRPITPSAILARMVITTALIFAAGFIITTIWAYTGGYPSLPLQGEIQLKATGEQTFVPYYPFFNRYVILNDGEVVPKESAFDRIGPIGIGTYFYTTIHAPHWVMEVNAPFMIFDLKNGNLRGMELIPYIMMFCGLMFFIKVMIPHHSLTPQSVLNYSIVISLFQSLLIIFILLAANAVSPSYASIYEGFKFYKGQFVGAVFPGVFIILIYSLFIGAVVGSIYSTFLYYYYLTVSYTGTGKIQAPQK